MGKECSLFDDVQPPTQGVPKLKRQESEYGHSLPTSTASKNTRVYISSPHTPSWLSA
jgi:hypothetical protein